MCVCVCAVCACVLCRCVNVCLSHLLKWCLIIANCCRDLTVSVMSLAVLRRVSLSLPSATSNTLTKQIAEIAIKIVDVVEVQCYLKYTWICEQLTKAIILVIVSCYVTAQKPVPRLI